MFPHIIKRCQQNVTLILTCLYLFKNTQFNLELGKGRHRSTRVQGYIVSRSAPKPSLSGYAAPFWSYTQLGLTEASSQRKLTCIYKVCPGTNPYSLSYMYMLVFYIRLALFSPLLVYLEPPAVGVAA